MKSSLSLFVVSVFFTAALPAGAIDKDDPRRALGREDDIRIDAQLLQETVSPSSHLTITYQIENLTGSAVAVAEKLCDVSYDADSRTITVGVGSEVPKDGRMPRMTVVPPGGKKTFTVGGILRVAASAMRSPFGAIPRLVQIKVSVLRDLQPFRALLQKQSEDRTGAAVELSDSQFERWLEGNDTIYLNTIPVRFDPRGAPAIAESDRPAH